MSRLREKASLEKKEPGSVGHASGWALKIYDGQEPHRLKVLQSADEAAEGDFAHRALGVERELHRILSSATFRRSNRLRRMLEHITRQVLLGHRDLLKEYTIGLEVFDRGSSFDPTSDPIVRVEASRLRHQLHRYYSSEGRHSTLRIELPKGTYIPVICEGLAHTVSSSPGPGTTAKGILVLPFLLWGNSNHANPAHTLIVSDQLIYLLTQSSPFRVLSRFAALNAAPEMDAKQLGKHFNARFIVEGSVRIGEDGCSVVTHLVDTEHSCNLWSGRYRTTTEGLLSVADNAFADVMKCLESHSPHGIDNAEVENGTTGAYKP